MEPQGSVGAAPATGTQPTVLLVGRANAGKSSVHMHLTGADARPVNFPGSSVERTEGTCRMGREPLMVIDLPGFGSMDPVSPDERLAVQELRDMPEDGVVCVVLDATRLSVDLFLLQDVLPLGRRVVVALTKNDLAARLGSPVDSVELARHLALPVVEVNARKGRGMDGLVQALEGARSQPPATAATWEADEVAQAAQRNVDPHKSVWTDRLDSLLLHPWLGLPLLVVAMYGVFQLVFTAGDIGGGWVEAGQEALSDWTRGLVSAGLLQGFLVDGLINGLGSVLVFVPQIAVLIALVAAAEGSGYLARAAFLLDRPLSRVGLHGRSFLPLSTSFACAIPGVLAARTLEDERDRLATIAVAPLMSCSARLPVYVIMIGALFTAGVAPWILLGLYLTGIVAAALVALALRGTVLRGGRSPLLLELPHYSLPSTAVVWKRVRTTCGAFLKSAGGVIFVGCVAIWALSVFPRDEAMLARYEAARTEAANAIQDEAARSERIAQLDAQESAEILEQSWLADIGRTAQPVFAPAGFDWRTTVAVLASFPARELFVPSLGVLLRAGDVDPGDYDLSALEREGAPDGLRARIRNAEREDGSPLFPPHTGLALMLFFALCSQCVATLGVIRQETRSWRWPAFVFGYMTVAAWLVAVVVHQIGAALA